MGKEKALPVVIHRLPVNIEVKDAPGNLCTAVRWRVGICGFFTLLFTQTFRVNFSVGLSCMVGQNSTEGLSSFTDIASNFTALISSGAGQAWLGFSVDNEQNEEFDWSKQTQGTLLSAYGYGYILSQVPGGWLSRRYGTRRVIGFSMIAAMVITALTPICARTHEYLLFAARVLLGSVQGMCYPALFNLAGRWIPPLETSRYMALTLAGGPIGIVIAFVVSGILCRFGFDEGWGSIFYVFDFLAIGWIVIWFYMVYDTPLKHPRISQVEKTYIVERVGRYETKEERRQMTPWCGIAMSLPVWGTAVAYFTNDWLNQTLQLGLVVYLEQVLGYKIAASGLLGVLPLVVQFVSGLVVGYWADWIVKRNTLTTVNARRILQAISFGLMGGLLIATGFVTSEHSGFAVGFLILSRVLIGFSMAGYLSSVMDFAPRFAGEITGIFNVVASFPQYTVPLLITILTPNGSQNEWRNVFLVTGAVAILGGIFYCILVRGEIQTWAEFIDVGCQEEKLMKEAPPTKDDTSSMQDT